MPRLRIIVVGGLLAWSLMLSGRKKKKPPVPAPQAQAPTITEPAAQPESKPAEPTIAEPQPAPPPETKPSPAVITPKSKPRVTNKTTKKTTPSTDKPGGKIVVQEGGKQDPAPPPLTAGTSHDEAAQQRLSTAQLIQTTEYNVRSITRTLTTEEQAIVQHIRGYIDQSKQATKDGDTERAYNLAIKAHLLSDSLKK